MQVDHQFSRDNAKAAVSAVPGLKYVQRRQLEGLVFDSARVYERRCSLREKRQKGPSDYQILTKLSDLAYQAPTPTRINRIIDKLESLPESVLAYMGIDPDLRPPADSINSLIFNLKYRGDPYSELKRLRQFSEDALAHLENRRPLHATPASSGRSGRPVPAQRPRDEAAFALVAALYTSYRKATGKRPARLYEARLTIDEEGSPSANAGFTHPFQLMCMRIGALCTPELSPHKIDRCIREVLEYRISGTRSRRARKGGSN